MQLVLTAACYTQNNAYCTQRLNQKGKTEDHKNPNYELKYDKLIYAAEGKSKSNYNYQES